MKIVHFTNTYLPHVGGVANSVRTIAERLRRDGHEVMVIAPEFEGDDGKSTEGPEGVRIVRVKAIQDFNKSGFSWRIPGTGDVSPTLREFDPDLIHSHHPFLLGDTAVRFAYQHERPVVFTHHTRYDEYTHYLMKPNETLRRIATELAGRYEQLCDGVIAPSESIRDFIRGQAVDTPIEVIPTGIDPEKYSQGDGAAFREKHGIPAKARVAGHVGRLAPEKNLPYLARAGAEFLRWHDDARLLVVGDGDSAGEMRRIFEEERVQERVIMPGKLTGQALVNAYHAMDVFLFSSHTETQGMVIAEAMTAGKPVVALDASGVREVLRDGKNGFLLDSDAPAGALARATGRFFELADEERQKFSEAAVETAHAFSLETSHGKLIQLYEKVSRRHQNEGHTMEPWEEFLNRAEAEWELLTQKTLSAWRAIFEK